jgi:adenosylcobinamide-phosphate synthase
MSIKIVLFAYLIDRVFGEFPIKHPVVFMGDYIKWFEERFYRDRVLHGAILTITLVLITFMVVHSITIYIGYMPNIYIEILLLSIIASTTISTKMLYESVKDIIKYPKNIKYLVSRDTEYLSSSDINKASIETYAENLSDGVIAPLFYLFIFGIDGAFVYKAINTLDSMVGYRNNRYERFGKFSAILDDIVNYIPSRITATLISILFFDRDAIMKFYSFGRGHSSPNAGHPISAMALAIGVKLGGDTSYFGEIKQKPYFGEKRVNITTDDINKALSFQLRLDIFFVVILALILLI